jgi:SAM-dependent methyltransferase
MAERARVRIGGAPNATVAIEDGQSLSFPNASFDTVVCNLGLMFFSYPAGGLAEFRRVLRPGGRAAVSVATTAEHTYDGQVFLALARYVPHLAEAAARMFSLGDEARLRLLFEAAGFRDVEVTTETHCFVLPSFDAYFGPFEGGGGSTGQAYLGLPEDQRRAVREQVRREVGGAGGPVAIETDIRIASGQR